jgi:hypothetical protein
MLKFYSLAWPINPWSLFDIFDISGSVSIISLLIDFKFKAPEIFSKGRKNFD